MQCFVYRSRKRRDAYLYLPAEADFSHLPAGLIEAFGPPELALTFELTPDRRLATADATQVLAQLQSRGYYLQMPAENDLPA
jgi:uncharacterized protein YcgL (UPF0745 family)